MAGCLDDGGSSMLKQVIIVRKDLNMRKGKMIAQGAHASLTAAFAPCALIQDHGLTEFGGVPTYTAVAIGPAEDVVIDRITGELSLL